VSSRTPDIPTASRQRTREPAAGPAANAIVRGTHPAHACGRTQHFAPTRGSAELVRQGRVAGDRRGADGRRPGRPDQQRRRLPLIPFARVHTVDAPIAAAVADESTSRAAVLRRLVQPGAPELWVERDIAHQTLVWDSASRLRSCAAAARFPFCSNRRSASRNADADSSGRPARARTSARSAVACARGSR
jgi:hypothetical protein